MAPRCAAVLSSLWISSHFSTAFSLFLTSSIIGNEMQISSFEKTTRFDFFYNIFCLDEYKKSGKALKYFLFVLFLEMLCM